MVEVIRLKGKASNGTDSSIRGFVLIRQSFASESIERYSNDFCAPMAHGMF